MADRPILFNDAMVRAILSGTKTQTRRLVKPQPPAWAQHPQPAGDGWEWTDRHEDADDLRHWPDYYKPMRCPYGQPGDRLWVREAWRMSAFGPMYRADGDDAFGWKPSIHMPRRFSRIDLEVTGVRVERLQQIDEADAEAEGVQQAPQPMATMYSVDEVLRTRYRQGFAELWESINGPGSWDANPWAWVVEFKRVGGGND